LTASMPSPDIVFDTLYGYQRSAALNSAIDIEVFTAIDEGAQIAAAIATRCGASERGVRILCDYLSVIGLLQKVGTTYQLVPESATFLSKRSPAYLGSAARFLRRPELKRNFDDLTGTIRRGGVAPEGNTVADDNPIWVEFARSMMPMMMPAANAIADLLGVASLDCLKVLDVAAGHGLFGIAIARRNPRAEIVAVDWKQVLAVAEENARAAEVQGRYHTVPGDVFKVDVGTGYDVVLVTNFLHHFDHQTCTSFLHRMYAALKSGGKIAVLEFVPNPDRVSPPIPASFSLTMLAGTPSGEAYTFVELRQQLQDAGFRNVSAHSLPTPQTVLLAEK
jgi:2-polyprenyl-3-methyl-5-hydroxy-6-metoxy-1,4-benzoquinol methylase